MMIEKTKDLVNLKSDGLCGFGPNTGYYQTRLTLLQKLFIDKIIEK